MQEKTYLKVVLLGKVNSGKTCLVTRYITRAFSEETPSVSTFKINRLYTHRESPFLWFSASKTPAVTKLTLNRYISQDIRLIGAVFFAY